LTLPDEKKSVIVNRAKS